MNVQKVVRQVILGSVFIESDDEYKKTMFSGKLALLAILLSLFYLIGDYLQGFYYTTYVYLSAIAVFSFSIYLHRAGRHCLANYFLLPVANMLVYLMASSETPGTGTFVFFITTSLAAFTVFGYKQRLLSVFFLGFTFVLFVLAYYPHFSLLPLRHYSSDRIVLNMVVNFTVALPASAMCIYLQVSFNYQNAKQLREKNALLSKANTELDRFVYSTSHDLRAPLASVLGLINVIHTTENLSDIRRYLGLMKDRVNALEKFIKDITDYSRNSRLEMVKEKLNVKYLVEEIWDMLKYTPEAEHIRMIIEVPENIEMETDRTRLKVVLGNLISNSIRYHDPAKQDKYIRLRYQENSQSFYLMVEDNGQGIDPQHHQRVFDMFFRASETSKGSGLGLFIVKETLDKLSGSIQLESRPGIGTTFKVVLPV
jgi:signal transduction histidine kinase